MRRIGAIAAFLALLLAACTSSNTGSGDPTSPDTTIPAPTTAPDSAPARPSITHPAPPHPSRPTVPADVPTTGPNVTKANEKPPVEPLEATQHTPAGATAFAAFFIKTIDWGYATTSSTYMRHYFEHSCIDCRSSALGLDGARQRHRHFIGDRFSIRRVISPGAIGAFVERVIFDVTAAEVVDRNGHAVDGLPPLKGFQETVHLTWRRGRWFVASMTPKQ